MDKYAGVGTQTVANPADTTMTLTGIVARRGKLYELIQSQISAPADITVKTTVQRITAIGTGTGFTALPLDPSAPGAQLVCNVNHTVEPTYTASAILLEFGMNQRATFRWVAYPGGEIIIPAVVAEGVGIFTVDVAAAATPDVEVTAHWEE
jgi:hypothetical protein